MLLGLLWPPGWSFSIAQHIGWSLRQSRLPEPDRVENREAGLTPGSRFVECCANLPWIYPPRQISCQLGLFRDSKNLSHLGDPVPPIFLQLPLIFFNQHSQRGFYPLSWLSLDILLPLRRSLETTTFLPLVILA
jgi:hypothetical protein